MGKQPQHDFKITKFRACKKCGSGIGITTYHSGLIDGDFCSSDHYVDTVMDNFNIKPELEPEEEGDK